MQDEIQRTEWANYFRAFSQRNQARPTTLEILSDLGAQREERRLPLAGISVEASGTEAPRIEVMLGGLSATESDHLTHTITHVRHVRYKLGADGRDEALEIETEDGTRTLLEFVPQAELPAAV